MNTILEASTRARPIAVSAKLREAEVRYLLVTAVFSPESADAKAAWGHWQSLRKQAANDNP